MRRVAVHFLDGVPLYRASAPFHKPRIKVRTDDLSSHGWCAAWPGAECDAEPGSPWGLRFRTGAEVRLHPWGDGPYRPLRRRGRGMIPPEVSVRACRQTGQTVSCSCYGGILSRRMISARQARAVACP